MAKNNIKSSKMTIQYENIYLEQAQRLILNYLLSELK